MPESVKSDDIEGAKKILDPNAVKGYCYPENFERLARAEQLAKEKNCTVPQIALAWILNQDFEVFPLVSARKGEQDRKQCEGTWILYLQKKK